MVHVVSGIVPRICMLALLVACVDPNALPPSDLMQRSQATRAIGNWQSLSRSDQGPTTILEQEYWHIELDPTVAETLRGHYRRVVTFRNRDGALFACNQRSSYQQFTTYTVTGRLDQAPLTLRETAFEAEPSPCEHAFRRLTTYQVSIVGPTLGLQFADGNQTLWPVPERDHLGALIADAADSHALHSTLAGRSGSAGLDGIWRSELTTMDERGDMRTEAEAWQFTESAGQVWGTYRRDVTVRSSDGAPFQCARAPLYDYHDVIEFTAHRQGETQEHELREIAIAADPAPCLAAMPGRALNQATFEKRGNYIVLDWRGKRRQVLYRE